MNLLRFGLNRGAGRKKRGCSMEKSVFRIMTPQDSEPLHTLGEITGYGIPFASIAVQVDLWPVLKTNVNETGFWKVEMTNRLEPGMHRIRAKMQKDCGCCLQDGLRIIVLEEDTSELTVLPVILSPESNIVSEDRRPVISGVAEPESRISVCLSGIGCLHVLTNEQGHFHVQFPGALPNGTYTIVVTQDNCNTRIYHQFTVGGGVFLPPPSIEAP